MVQRRDRRPNSGRSDAVEQPARTTSSRSRIPDAKLGRPVAHVHALQAQIAADAVLDVNHRITHPQFRKVADHRLDVRGALALASAQTTRACRVQLGFCDDGDARVAQHEPRAGATPRPIAASDAIKALKSALSANGNRYSVSICEIVSRRPAESATINARRASPPKSSTNARSRLMGSSARRSTASNGKVSNASCVPSPNEMRP